MDMRLYAKLKIKVRCQKKVIKKQHEQLNSIRNNFEDLQNP